MYMQSSITFKVMLVGESGLGKTTFTRALLRPYVPENLLDEPPDSVDSGPVRSRTTDITETVHRVKNDDNGATYNVEFSVVDCPGYGDSVDSTAWIDKIVAHITDRFAEHYDNLGYPPKQDTGNDKLVHVCLYFIAAHRLKGVDLEFLKRLQPYVNLVPVIAKADTMTLAERDAFRRLVLAELKTNGIKIFQMAEMPSAPAKAPSGPLTPARDPSEADATSDTPRSNGAMPPLAKAATYGGGLAVPTQQPVKAISTTQPPPFAVCASEDGTRVYPWGTCYVEEPTHSDLSVLRSMLFANSMLTAKKTTIELFEGSYAGKRRAREQADHERQRRSFQREVVFGRLVIVLGLCSMVGGAVAIWRPDWLVACSRGLDGATAKLARPRRMLKQAAGGVLGALLQGIVSMRGALAQAQLKLAKVDA